jgi:hypothetical protein
MWGRRLMHIGFWWKKPEGKILLGRPGWEDNIQMDLRGIVWGGMYWIDLDMDRDRQKAFPNIVMNVRVP